MLDLGKSVAPIRKFPTAPAKGHVRQNKYGAAKNVSALDDFLLLAQLEQKASSLKQSEAAAILKEMAGEMDTALED
ncbi:uncharacterized [Tachysurus ichikawai]